MQNLPSPSLVPTSQEGGNMIQPDLGSSAMSAPGSTPVSPLPGPTEGSDPEIDYSGPEIPVYSPGKQPRYNPPAASGDAGSWAVFAKGGTNIWREV